MNTKERTIHFYDLELNVLAIGAEIKNPSSASIGEVLELITKQVNPKGAGQVLKKTIMIEIADWKHDAKKDHYNILINQADRDASDVAFKDFKKKTLRKGNKTTDEGIDKSAHILIKPSEDKRRALMLITMGAGVTATLLKRVLNMLLRSLKAKERDHEIFNRPDPSGAVDQKGKPLTYKVKYSFSWSAHQGQLLTQALANGAFVGMDLIADGTKTFDAAPNLEIESHSISVRPKLMSGPVTAASLKNAVGRFVQTRQEFTTMRLKYKDSSGKQRAASMSVDHLDEAFTRKETVKLSMPVEQQQTNLSPIVVAAMQKLL